MSYCAQSICEQPFQQNVGTGYWKLIRADFISDGDILPPPGRGSESDGKHAIFYRARDIDGNLIDGQKVVAAWPTGSPDTAVTHYTIQ